MIVLEILAILILAGFFGWLFSIRVPALITIIIVLAGICLSIGWLMGVGFKFAIG